MMDLETKAHIMQLESRLRRAEGQLSELPLRVAPGAGAAFRIKAYSAKTDLPVVTQPTLAVTTTDPAGVLWFGDDAEDWLPISHVGPAVTPSA